jgi:PTS system N-acetylglucosamine-specific IIC component
MKNIFPAIQKLGRSLMLPIAVLPVAGLLLRLGQPDLLNLPYVAAAGNAVFANLGLLFAIGVAVGLARGNNGAAGLAAVVAYLVTTEGAKVLVNVPVAEIGDATGNMANLLSSAYKDAAIAKLSVPAGLISGIMAGNFYNRFCDIRLPDYLAFSPVVVLFQS